uniref:Uncharacterized protein n=1 Tax=Caenorhabditis japonica TaxID=281687 RepID=A0A8R1DVL5_CAEJA
MQAKESNVKTLISQTEDQNEDDSSIRLRTTQSSGRSVERLRRNTKSNERQKITTPKLKRSAENQIRTPSSETKTKKSMERARRTPKLRKSNENQIKGVSESKASKKSTKSTKKSMKKSVERGKKKPRSPDASDEDLPPTANSDKSMEKKKKKIKVSEGSESRKGVGAAASNAPTPMATTALDQPVEPIQVTPGCENSRTPENEPKKVKKALKRESNHIFHLRPGVSKKNEHLRRKHFEEELIEMETGEFTYLTDPTRYRFRSTPPIEVIIQLVVPSLLILVIALATAAIIRFLATVHTQELSYNEMNEMTLSKYDSYMIVDSM